MPELLLQVEHLSLCYHSDEGDVQAVRDVSFSLAEGGTLAIVGESGCGKSTLSLALMRLLSPSAKIAQGKIEFSHANLEVVMRRLARWYNFKYMFENESAKDHHFTARLNNDQSISSILEMLEMTTDVKFNIRDHTIVIL